MRLEDRRRESVREREKERERARARERERERESVFEVYSILCRLIMQSYSPDPSSLCLSLFSKEKRDFEKGRPDENIFIQSDNPDM